MATSGNYLESALPTQQAVAPDPGEETLYGEESPLSKWINDSRWNRDDLELLMSAVSLVLSIVTIFVMRGTF